MGTENSNSENAESVSSSDESLTQDSETKQSSASEADASDETNEASDTSNNDDSSDDESGESQDDAGKDDLPKKKSGFQKRIEKLNKRVSDRDQEIEYLRSQIVKASKSGESGSGTSAERTQKSEPTDKPRVDDFETHEDYVEALADWKFEQKLAAREAKETAEKSRKAHNDRLSSHQAKVTEFVKSHSDWGDLVQELQEDNFQVAVAVEEAILESGPELMYELMRDRKELERINALPYGSAKHALGKFEARLEARKSETHTEKKPKPPQPLKPLAARSGGPAKSIYDKGLSFSDYEQLRREQLSKK